MKKPNLLLATLLCLLSFNSYAAYSPLSISILPPAQFPPQDYTITGVRLSVLWGSQRDIYGLDLGMVGNITQQDFVGLGVSGLFNVTKGQTTILGLQLAGLTNINLEKTDVYGFQVAAALNYNEAASSITGVQLAAVNLAANTTINGFQVGLYNRALTVRGIQLGVVNVTNNLHGIQIGLLNFNYTGLFYVAPVLNIGF